MGAMAKLKEEDKKAEEQMEEFAKLQSELPPEDEPIGDILEVIEEIPPIVEVPPIVEPPATVPDEIEQLKAEVLRLQAQIDDENNPTWMQKYNTLNGMQKVLAQQLQDLKGEIAELRSPKIVEPVRPSIDVSAARKRLEETYTPETIDDILSVAGADSVSLKEKIRQLEANLQSYQQDIGQVKTDHKKTAEQAFISDLTNRVPDWKKLNGWTSEGINPDPNFLIFLDKLLPGTRETYRERFKRYQEEGDAEMTAGLFKIFELQQVIPVTPPDIPKPSANLEKHIEPGKTVSGAPPSVADKTKKTYSMKAVEKFFDDMNKGRFKGKYTQAELDTMSDEYTLAIAEGRVK
jgi:hypothetical protein